MERKLKTCSYNPPEALAQAENLMNSGKYKEALSILNNLEELESLDPSDLLECLLIQGSILNKLGHYQECYNVSEKAYYESQKLNNSLKSVDALVNMANALIWLGDFEKVDKKVAESDELLESLGNKPSKELEKREASLAFVKASISWFKGDMNKAVEHGKISLKLSEKHNNKHQIAEALYAIGQAYSFLKTDLKKAFDYAKRCQTLAEEINHRQIINFNRLNLGIIYSLRGEYEKALINHKKCLPFFEESNNLQWMSANLTNTAVVYWHQGKYDEAVENFEKSLKLSREMGNIWFIALSLNNLVEGYKLKGDIDQAKVYLEELKQFCEKGSGKWFETLYLASKAAILKESPRLHDRTKAEKILKQVIGRELLPNLDINIDALVNLCELLLDELGITNDIRVIDDLDPYLKQLVDIAEKNNSIWILTESYILQAKLALITLDLKGARRLLTQAQRIAEKHGMNRLAAKVSHQHDELLEKLNLWNDIKDSESSLSERIELAKIKEQMKNMSQKRRSEFPEIIEENPIMILVISEGGIPTFTKLFTEKFVVEEDLISGFLSAFNSFSGELFSEGLDRASFGEFKLIMKPISSFLVCYLFKGQSFSAQKRIHNFVENIEKNKELLARFDKSYRTSQIINLEEFPQLNSLITECFLEKVID